MKFALLATLFPLSKSLSPTCFIDDVDNRQLPTDVCTGGLGLCEYLTTRVCADECRKLNFTISGVEAGHACSCGDALTAPDATAPLTECDSPCTGNATETCGASLRLYAFDSASLPPPPPPAVDPTLDARHVPNGDDMYIGGYSCQPYCSVLPDDSWSCVVTLLVDSPYEGGPGMKMVAMQSPDYGKSWTEPVDIDTDYDLTTTHQASAYGSPLARPDGSRVFAIWVKNVNNVDHLPGDAPDPGGFRADMLGNFVWKFSDDKGATWNDEAYVIPVPFTYIESINSWSEAQNGTGNETDTQIMWEVDTIKTLSNGTVLFAFTKIGVYAVAPPEEMYVMASHNLLTEEDPEMVEWVMWPEGWHGPGAVDHLDDAADDAVAEER